MPSWLGTSIVLAVVAGLIGAVLFFQIRAKRQGKSGCSCGCEHCAAACKMKKNKDESN